jgi:hypothetical protein
MAGKVHHNAERGVRHLSDLTGGDGFPTNGIALCVFFLRTPELGLTFFIDSGAGRLIVHI